MAEDIQFLIVLAALGASVGALITAGLAFRQFRHIQNSYEVDLSLRLSERFHRDKNMRKVTTAITYGRPILKENGGKIEEDDLIEYLATFSDTMRFLDMGVLSLETVDDLFRVYIDDLIKNKEIQDYIKLAQKEQGGDIWKGVKTLAEELKKLDS